MTEVLDGNSGLWLLFSTGFLSATLLPGGSEVNVVAAIAQGSNPLWKILAAVTIGNTLGGLSNYLLGRFVPSRVPKGPRAKQVLNWLKRHGAWSLLLSWLPVIGDPLCVAAGWLRLNLWWSTLAILVGKGLRYVVLAFAII